MQFESGFPKTIDFNPDSGATLEVAIGNTMITIKIFITDLFLLNYAKQEMYGAAWIMPRARGC